MSRLIDADALIAQMEADAEQMEEPIAKMFTYAAINDVKHAPTIEPEPHWIPVTERLPEDGTWNIFSDGKNISVERYKMDAIDHFFPQGRWFSFDKAIAWMPLPKL